LAWISHFCPDTGAFGSYVTSVHDPSSRLTAARSDASIQAAPDLIAPVDLSSLDFTFAL